MKTLYLLLALPAITFANPALVGNPSAGLVPVLAQEIINIQNKMERSYIYSGAMKSCGYIEESAYLKKLGQGMGDTIGMTEDEISTLFEPYYVLNRETERGQKECASIHKASEQFKNDLR